MQIFGKANLEIDSESSASVVIIDLKLGEIIVQPQKNEIIENNFHEIFDKEISLTSFSATIKEGDIRSKNLPKVFVKNVHQNHNILDSITLRSFKFLDKYKGTELILKPYNSRIDLQFTPSNINEEFTEFHFINVNIPTSFDFKYKEARCSASLDKSGHAIITGNQNLSEKERGELSNIFTITCCLGQGGYSLVREIITRNDFVINLAGYDIVKPPFKLVSQKDFEELFNSVKTSFSQIKDKELSLLKNATYYLEGGYKQSVHLEFRTISLFTSIEILDKSKTLDKSQLKSQFDLSSLYDAALLIEIRNQLIHNGLSIQKAVRVAEEKNNENDKSRSELSNLIEKNADQKHLVIYYFLLDLITSYLHSKFGYEGNFNTNLSTL